MIRDYLEKVFNGAFESNLRILEERWKRPNRPQLPTVEVRGRKYHYEQCNEGEMGSYILHGLHGARYCLVGEDSHYILVNTKSKKVVEKIGKFRVTESGLEWIRPVHNLTEGGAAASNLIPQLVKGGASPDLQYSKISANDMKTVFNDVIKPLLIELGESGFIDPNYKTEFSLGSTRLAAKIAGERVKLLPSEDEEAVAKASAAKTAYGDLDIDIVLRDGKTLRDVGDYLSQKYPDKIAYKLTGSEANMAYVWDGKVLQIDIVNVSGPDKNKMEFTQSSSIVDISQGVKGVFQSILTRSILGVKELTPEEKEQITDAVGSNPEIQKWVSQGYDFKVPGIDTPGRIGRWQLGGDGIYLVVDIFKAGKKEGDITRKTIKLTSDPRIGFDSLDQIADAIMSGADLDIITSAVKSAKMFRQKYPEKVQQLWDDFSRSMEHQRKGIDEEDFERGMNVIKTALGVKE